MTIIYTAEAERRLREVFNYYSLNASRKVALKIVTEIITETEILATKPHIGVIEPLLDNRKHKYFYIVVNNYKIIYRISEELIVISTVFDTRQNPRKIRRRLK